MRRLILTVILAGVAAGALAAQPVPALRLSGSLGVPGVVGADVETVLPGSLAGRIRVAPVVQASFLPISLFASEAEGIFFATATLAFRTYFTETADRWFAMAGISTILIHSEKWEKPVYGRGYAVSIPVGVGWRGVWGSFTQAVELGADLPIAVEAVFAKAYDGSGPGRLNYVNRIPVIGFVPRLHLTLGWHREGR